MRQAVKVWLQRIVAYASTTHAAKKPRVPQLEQEALLPTAKSVR